MYKQTGSERCKIQYSAMYNKENAKRETKFCSNILKQFQTRQNRARHALIILCQVFIHANIWWQYQKRCDRNMHIARTKRVFWRSVLFTSFQKNEALIDCGCAKLMVCDWNSMKLYHFNVKKDRLRTLSSTIAVFWLQNTWLWMHLLLNVLRT